MQIMTSKTTILRTFYVNVILNGVIFRKIHMKLCYMLDTFYLLGFFPSITLINYASSYRKIWIMNNARD